MNITRIKYGALAGLFSLWTVSMQAISEKDFFKQTLQGLKTALFPSRAIALSKVKTWQDKVWKAWTTANKEYQEEKLPALTPLSEGKSSVWHIPDSLEPHAAMPYYWGVKGHSASVYPLFLYLHGSGPKEGEWATGLKICNNFEDAPSIYFIPQIPNEGSYYRWWQKGKQYAWNKLLRQALASGSVDPDRIYFFGISEGGYGSQRLASFYADYLAGAGPMAGGEPLKNAPAENCANIAFSFITGEKDNGFFRNLLTTYTKAALDSLEKAHPGYYRHRIILQPGAGHFVNYKLTTPWLAQYRRNPYPRYFCWEDYDMDGQHRNGFYNLEVRERPRMNATAGTDAAPQTDARTRYEMTVTGNRVSLNIQHVTYTTDQTASGIDLHFRKSYAPATGGKLTVYLCGELVDLQKDVTIEVNGQVRFKGRLKADLRNMMRSCSTFYDPRRIYPAAADISY